MAWTIVTTQQRLALRVLYAHDGCRIVDCLRYTSKSAAYMRICQHVLQQLVMYRGSNAHIAFVGICAADCCWCSDALLRVSMPPPDQLLDALYTRLVCKRRLFVFVWRQNTISILLSLRHPHILTILISPSTRIACSLPERPTPVCSFPRYVFAYMFAIPRTTILRNPVLSVN